MDITLIALIVLKAVALAALVWVSIGCLFLAIRIACGDGEKWEKNRQRMKAGLHVSDEDIQDAVRPFWVKKRVDRPTQSGDR